MGKKLHKKGKNRPRQKFADPGKKGLKQEKGKTGEKENSSSGSGIPGGLP